MASYKLGRGWALLCLVAFAPACSQVLGLEDREATATGGASTGGSASGGTGGGAAGSGGTAGTGGTGISPECTQYCDLIEANCLVPQMTGDPSFEQWTSRAQCEASCVAFPPGDPSAMNPSGNSLACRSTQASFAGDTGEPEAHCSAAGPAGVNRNGDFICGRACDGFCALMAVACTGTGDDANKGFLNEAECQADCALQTDLVGFDTSIDSGDSLQCRIWHVSAALKDPVTHCKHARGAAPCAPPATGGAGGTGGTGTGGTGTGGSAGVATGGTAGSAGAGTGGSGG